MRGGEVQQSPSLALYQPSAECVRKTSFLICERNVEYKGHMNDTQHLGVSIGSDGFQEGLGDCLILIGPSDLFGNVGYEKTWEMITNSLARAGLETPRRLEVC